MTLNDRFDAAADAESAPDEQILAVREGDELLSHFQPPGRGTTATKDTLVVSRNNAGFGDGTGSDDNGDRRLDDAAPSKVLLGEQRDQYVKVKEEESIPGSGSAHALADDSEGRSEEGGGSSGKGRDDAMSYSPNQEDEHNRSRPRRAETAATTHHGEVAHPTSGQDLPSSPSSEANGGGDGNGSFSATETRIELESDMLAVADEERSGSAEVGGIGNTRPRQRSRHGNEGGTPADTTHASSSADTPHLPPSRSQVFATTPTVARNGEDSLKDGSVDPALAISLKKDVESSTSDDATTSTLTPPSSPACHAAGNTEGVDCGGGRAPEVTPGGNEAEGMNDAIDDAGAPTPFVFSAVPARFGRPESIAVGVEDDFVGTGDKKGRKGRNGGGRRRGGGSASESSVGTDSAFNFADGGLELGGSTASGEPGNSPDVDRVLDAGCSNHGGGGGGGDGRMGGCDPLSLTQNFMVSPASPYSQALHMILACAVFVLVAVHKAGDGGVPSRSNVSIGGSFASGAGTESSGSSSKRRPPGTRGATFRTDSTRRSSNEGTKRRKSGSGAGFPASRPPLLRRLRAAWSKLWHAAEKELATHWRAAGQALASLRQAWGALWVPPPHAEADVLAEALASPPRFRCRAVHGHGSVTVGVGASSDRRRRRRRRGSRNAGHQDVGTGGKSAGAGSSAQDAYVRGESATEPRRKLGLHFLNLWGFRPLMDPSGGRGSRSRSPKFLLVLDLDETLVHCSPYPLDPATRRPRSDGSVRHVRPDLKVEMRGGAPSDRPACMYAWKRPHLDVFLGIVSRWYEIAVFTSGRRCYAEVRAGLEILRGGSTVHVWEIVRRESMLISVLRVYASCRGQKRIRERIRYRVDCVGWCCHRLRCNKVILSARLDCSCTLHCVVLTFKVPNGQKPCFQVLVSG